MADDTRKPISWLRDNIDKPNIAEDLDEDTLTRLGQRVIYGYDIDKMSRTRWEELTIAGLKVATQETETKSSPWPNCANVKHPLIAIASIQFAARAYPNIIKGPDVVKAQVVGADPDGQKELRAKRVSQHMSWQCTDQMTDWEESVDNLLHALPVIGLCYKKTYRDTLYSVNRSEFKTGLSVVVNENVKSLETARRVTDDEIWLYENDVIERERFGLFLKDTHKLMRRDPEENAPEQFLEQHTFADLDNDGYEEPYIVTVHRDTSKVARVVARYDDSGVMINRAGEVVRIEAVQYFTKFPFLPSPWGKYHPVGFAQLLGPLNETMNTLINQLLDSGTLANLQSGFIGRGIKWQGGVMRFVPGEWKQVDVLGGTLKENIVPLPIQQPSGVLFQLLGALSDMTDKLASVSDVMSGEMPSQNTPATTVLAMIEQGLKVFTSIYKRVFRSLKAEYKKLYRLNRLYLPEEEYYRVLDVQGAVFRADYDGSDLDVIPVADPTISSEAQKLARGRALLETLQTNPSPAGKAEILRRYYEALDVPLIDKVLPPQEIKALTEGPQPPNPDMLRLEADIMKQKHDYELAYERLELDRMKLEADIKFVEANAIKAIAEAESKEVGQQFELYRHEVEQLSNQVKLNIEIMKEKNRAQEAAASPEGGATEPGSGAEPAAGSPGGMEAGSTDQGSVPVPAGDQGAVPGPIDIESRLGGEDGAANYLQLGADLRGQYRAGNGDQ